MAAGAIEHFQASAPHSSSNEVWFDCGGEPLNWQLPAGVLFDAYASRPAELPWPITVHFQSYPSAQV